MFVRFMLRTTCNCKNILHHGIILVWVVQATHVLQLLKYYIMALILVWVVQATHDLQLLNCLYHGIIFS